MWLPFVQSVIHHQHVLEITPYPAFLSELGTEKLAQTVFFDQSGSDTSGEMYKTSVFSFSWSQQVCTLLRTEYPVKPSLCKLPQVFEKRIKTKQQRRLELLVVRQKVVNGLNMGMSGGVDVKGFMSVLQLEISSVLCLILWSNISCYFMFVHFFFFYSVYNVCWKICCM